jgi:hypothetical protein
VHLAHAVGGKEARDENVRIGQVELLGLSVSARRSDAVEAAAVTVEDRTEHRRRIKALWAVPVDRAVGSDERRAVEIADDAVLGHRQISG